MKIVHIMGYFVPELGYQEYYISKQHAKMGHEVHVIASDMIYPFENVIKMYKDAGIDIRSRKRKPGTEIIEGIHTHWMPHILEYTDFIICKSVKKKLEEIKPDIVFAHESRQGLPCQTAKYKDKLGFKLIVDQHDFYHKIKGRIKSILRNIEYFGFRRFLIDYNFKKADKIIPVTKHTKEFLIKTHKIPEEKLKLIELGVDTDTYYPREVEALNLRKRLNFDKQDIILMFVGTIYRRKKLELLIKAVNEIKDNKNLKLLIVGDGEVEYMDELKNLVKELNLENKIIFNGFANKKELPVYYTMADVGVWPANNSVSIIEAMACNLPIIMVDWQMPHLVSHENGFKFPFHDKEKLKECIIKLAEDKELRKKMGENSGKAANEIYSYKAVAERFLDAAK